MTQEVVLVPAPTGPSEDFRARVMEAAIRASAVVEYSENPNKPWKLNRSSYGSSLNYLAKVLRQMRRYAGTQPAGRNKHGFFAYLPMSGMIRCSVCGFTVHKDSKSTDHTNNHLAQVAVVLGVELGQKLVKGEDGLKYVDRTVSWQFTE